MIVLVFCMGCGMRKNELVDIEADLVHETEKAYLINPGNRNGDGVWLAKAYTEWDQEAGVFTLPLRIAEEKELV